MYFKPKRYPKPARRPVGVFTGKAKESEMYGIRSKSKFAKLKSFKDCEFFGLDCMHLLSGVAKQFWKLLTGEFGKKNNPFFLKLGVLKEIGEAIARSKRTIPSALDACITNISKTTGLKSI